jgi:predicted RNA-binding protein Jag
MDYKKKVEQRRLINKLKREVQKEPAFAEKCKEYDRDPNFVNNVKITFEPLDVSAKTINGRVILNEKLFEDGDWTDQMRYCIHELTHVLQQEAGMVEGKVDQEDYLDDPNEQEAFQVQLEYMDENTPEEVQRYLEKLLDHHDIEGSEREEKKEELTKDID